MAMLWKTVNIYLADSGSLCKVKCLRKDCRRGHAVPRGQGEPGWKRGTRASLCDILITLRTLEAKAVGSATSI